MSNILENGTVLPSGLLGRQGMEGSIAAFNRSYRDTRLKAGIIVKSYAADDDANQNGLCTEYDVVTFEQFENKGSTSTLYRNCLSTQGFGGVADFLEFTLRPKTIQTNKGSPTFGDQDGAVVLIECLDGIGDKAVVTGCLIHPDRDTTITSTDPQLAGEYNGVNVEIENDGSCSLTFKGSTDSLGIPTDPSQGGTKIQITSDGSYEVSNLTTSFEMAKTSGDITTKTSIGDINTTTTLGDIATSAIAGAMTLKASLAELKLDKGKVALGGPTAELLDLFNQTLTQLITLTTSMSIETHLGNLGYPTSVPINAASYLAVMQSLTLIQVLLATIKGTL